METLVRDLRTNAQTVTLEERLWAASPWHIGKDIAKLFGGQITIRQHLQTKKVAGWLPRPSTHIERYYHSPTLSIGAVSDGRQTTIDVDPKRTDLVAVVQAYYDWARNTELDILEVTFAVNKDELNGVIRGKDWRFSATPTDEQYVRGTICAEAHTYPVRLQRVAEGLSSIMNKLIPDGGEGLLAVRHAPGGIDKMLDCWDEAMQEGRALHAAQLVMKRYVDGA